MEFDNEFSANDIYLIYEYMKNGTDDYYLCDFEGHNYVIPYKYTLNSQPEFYKGRFIADLTDFYENEPQLKHKEIGERAWQRYNQVIEVAREINEFGDDMNVIDFSAKALDNYKKKLKVLNAHKNKQQKKTSYKIPRKIKKLALGFGLTAVLGGGYMVSHSSDDNERKNTTHTVVLQDTPKPYYDFTGKEIPDPYGNIERINQLKTDIFAMLISVEGFSNDAFLDGVGTPTIGPGLTFYFDKKGNTKKVELGDTITYEKAMQQKWHYIEKEMMPIFSQKVGRPCSNRDILAGIGAAYCWGKNAFLKSSYFKAIKNNEPLQSKIRKISGFRKQKGLLKRGYLLANIQAGKWTAEDLLSLPVYKSHGAYLGCAIYRLQLHDIMPCRKDKEGNYLKDEYGNDVPVVLKDNFCKEFYTNRAPALMKRMCMAPNILKCDHVAVQDLMSEEDVMRLKSRKYNLINYIDETQNSMFDLAHFYNGKSK